MTADYAISVSLLGNDFERARVEASRLAAKYQCMFWWMPEPNNSHRFVFTNHGVILFFIAYLHREIIGEEDNQRIKRLFVSPTEIELFAGHCVQIRSVFEYARRYFSESTEAERAAMESVAPRFFEDLAQVFAEHVILSACRITDPLITRGKRNFVIEHFTNALVRREPLHRRLSELQASMGEHRRRIEDARNKLTAHADLETIRTGKPLGTASWPQWYQFWNDLEAFVSLVNEHVRGSPFEIRASGVRGDVEMVLKKLQAGD